MSDWKLHTPEGTIDLLPEACGEKTHIENEITDVFASYGYKMAETPIMQFYDVYDNKSSRIEQETMYKFFDKEGRILVLRPDITTCMARLVATKMSDGVYPKRLFYSGKVFRYVDNFASGQREFCQAGIELIGVSGDAADAEVIACAIEALLVTGLTAFQIEIGQTAFFSGIAEEAGLDEEQFEKLVALMDKKDSLAIEEYIKPMNISEKLKNLILSLPTLFGDIDVTDKIDISLLNEKSKAALINLKNIYRLLSDYGFEKYISVDLSLVNGINCYTGMIFRGITYSIGFSVCSGGRYDKLLCEYNENLPAVGMAIGTDRLIDVLRRQHLLHTESASDTLVFARDAVTAYRILTALRNEGFVAEQYLTDNSYENAEIYARKNNIQGIISIDEKGNVKAHNLIDGTVADTTLDELLEAEE